MNSKKFSKDLSRANVLFVRLTESSFRFKWLLLLLMVGVTIFSFYYSDSANTIEIHGRYIGDIREERSWKDWLVYLDVTNFLDKEYEKYYGRPGNERVFRVGAQRDF